MDILSLDVGSTKMTAPAVGGGGTIRLQRTSPTPGFNATAEELIAVAIELLTALRSECERFDPTIAISAAGFALPDGTVSWTRGEDAPTVIITWRDGLHKVLGMSVAVFNDAEAAAHAELRWGKLADIRRGAVAACGTFVGTAFVLGGQVFSSEAAVIERHDGIAGSLDFCGAQFSILAAERGLGELTAREVAERAHAGDVGCLAVADVAGCALGWWCAQVANVMLLERIVLAGPVAVDFGELLLGPARAQMMKSRYQCWPASFELILGAFGAQAPLVGAAAALCNTR